MRIHLVAILLWGLVYFIEPNAQIEKLAQSEYSDRKKKPEIYTGIPTRSDVRFTGPKW